MAYNSYRRVQTLSTWVASISGFFYLRQLLDEAQEEEVSPHPNAVQSKTVTEELEAGEDEEVGVQADENGEDDIEIPSEPPEDSWFIPMGLARQRPQTFYKGNDPEWQSFVEFSHDKKRCHFVTSMFYLSHLKRHPALTVLQMNWLSSWAVTWRTYQTSKSIWVPLFRQASTGLRLIIPMGLLQSTNVQGAYLLLYTLDDC